MENEHPSMQVPPLEAGTINRNNQPHDAEWARVPDVIKRFGIKRTRLYELLAEGQVKSVSLRRRGCVKGIRIVSCDSVRSLLETLASGEVK
jgi:hypothetical protein